MTAAGDAFEGLTLEAVVTGRGFADLPASPLQLAVIRASQGEPIGDVLPPPEIERHFGTSELPPVKPTVVELVCGVRSGKSFIGACAGIHAALTADLSQLKRHEIPRFAIIAPTVDAARATFVLLSGILQGSAVLRRFVESESDGCVVLKRPDGRRVEIVVVAAHRGGLSVRNRWLVGFVLEEVAQFGQEATGAAVNVEELLRAAETRLLPGCQGWLISSPFGPTGLLYETWKRHFGSPRRTLVVHAPTRAMNPSFPVETIEAIRAEQPDVAAREFDAEWTDAESAFFPATLVDQATRDAPLVLQGRACSAAMDPATRSNDWSLAVSWRAQVSETVSRVVIGGVWRWQGSKSAPLSPKETLTEIAEILRRYSVSQVYCDGWSFDSMQDHARAAGIHLVEHPAKDRDLPYQRLKTMLGNGSIELPPEPLLRQDLVAVRERALAGGKRIILPKTADGRHCDFVPSVALAAMHAEGESRFEVHAPPPRMAAMRGEPSRSGASFFNSTVRREEKARQTRNRRRFSQL